MPKIRLKQIDQNDLYLYVSGIVSANNANLNSINFTNPMYLDYQYNTISSNLNNNYFNIFNSTSDITASLPLIENRKKFLIKNMNVGVLTITPSGSQKIDGYNNLQLLSGQSAELIGITGNNFTGWIVSNTNIGLN